MCKAGTLEPSGAGSDLRSASPWLVLSILPSVSNLESEDVAQLRELA